MKYFFSNFKFIFFVVSQKNTKHNPPPQRNPLPCTPTIRVQVASFPPFRTSYISNIFFCRHPGSYPELTGWGFCSRGSQSWAVMGRAALRAACIWDSSRPSLLCPGSNCARAFYCKEGWRKDSTISNIWKCYFFLHNQFAAPMFVVCSSLKKVYYFWFMSSHKEFGEND